MNKNAIETFEKVNELLNEETHEHPEAVIKLYDRHQIWLATSSSVNTAAAIKNRCWYILNPEIGLGRILAAPISRSHVNGVPIDIGKNFLMYIRPDLCTPMSPVNFVRYLGVASKTTQELMEKYLRFLYLGDRSVLEDLNIIKEQCKIQHQNLSDNRDDPGNNFIATMDFNTHGNQTAAKLIKRIRSTEFGSQMDIRDFYLANILAETDMYTEDGSPQTRNYMKPKTYHMYSTTEKQCNQTVENQQEKNLEIVNEENENKSANIVRNSDADKNAKKKRRVYLKDLNKEELRFIENYKNIEVIKQLFGFGSISGLYRAKKVIKENVSSINEKDDIDLYQAKRIYSRLQNSTRSPYDLVREFSFDDIKKLRTFLCCVANGKYSGMNSIFGANRDYAIKRMSEEIKKWYNLND